MGMIVLTIRFGCELAALAALGWYGYREAGIALAVGLPVVAGALWGAWVAPRAQHRLRDPQRFAVESVVWLGAIASLVGVGRLELAIGFGALAFATALGARRYEPAPTARPS
jgi:hypothetical protein